MKKALFLFAAVCWVLSLITHVLSLAHVDVAATFPYIWALHIGFFLVLLPALVMVRKDSRIRQQPRLLQFLFVGRPRWLAIITAICFIYAIPNFLIAFGGGQGSPDIINGHYVIQVKGTILRTLSENEYHVYRAQELRGFSGHWMAFYSLAMLMIYPFAWPNTTAKTAASSTGPNRKTYSTRS